ncbi:hypothetical protein [Serratia rubidaea]|uniref:hypothetical protein n=1 Tax=Serratia rubidaea TaxID=61652 RepID=UPI0017874810|nr:hypothetical protein [Serratia rubidaea]MBD8454121.1 hypothetical protein [Serratia rubidaea]
MHREKVVVDNNYLSLPNGMMNAGQAASTLGQYMAQNGASAAEIAQAQSDLAKGLGTGAPQPATELVKKWALLMSTAATLGTGNTAKVVAEHGLIKDNKLTKMNNRDVYRGMDGNLYALDTQHGRFEVVTSQGKHVMEVNFAMKEIPDSKDKSGGHNLRVK